MAENFLKAVKWYLLSLSIIVGTSAFIVADKTGSMKPMMLGVLSYGVAYVATSFWKGFRGKLLLMSLLVFVVLTIISPFLADIIYILIGYKGVYKISPFVLWGEFVGLAGIPIMMFVFKKYD